MAKGNIWCLWLSYDNLTERLDKKSCLSLDTDYPIVSVIIPCFNQGRYLHDAIESVTSQGYPRIEIIVVDDGSTDETRQITEKYQGVKYVYQVNQGPSSARNTGIKNSGGDFLVFLDADDWLLPDAITTNLSYLEQNIELAFVSGGHKRVFIENGRTQNFIREIESDHYYHLLHGNYIGTPASVMFSRRLFDEFLYDPDLSACEEYDICLRIARKFPVQHHTKIISAYRIHSPSISSDPLLMLKTALIALGKQRKFLLNDRERRAYREGKRYARDYYYPRIYHESDSKVGVTIKERVIKTILKYPRLAYLKYLFLERSVLPAFKSFFKRNAPELVLRGLHKVGLYKRFVPTAKR